MPTKKVVLITGASSGIGKATALELLADGHTVYAAARRVERMQDLAERGGHPVALDVTDQESVEAVVSQILAHEQRLDVLVNNAGYAIFGAVEDTTLADARRQFEVNLFGLAGMTKAVLPTMRGQGSGTIINISSMGGKIYTPLGAWYHATKYALEGWSDCLRLELQSFGIDVVLVEPGIIDTEFDEVMTQPLLDRSAAGPYGPLAERVAAATQSSYQPGQSSPPEVIAHVISRAIAAKRPKTRYAAGKLARMLIFLRKICPDRLFDRVIMGHV